MQKELEQETYPDKPGVIAFPPYIYLSGLLLSMFLHWRRPLPLAPHALRKHLELPLIALGLLLFDQAFHTMKRAQTNVHPEQPARVLVNDGPFRLTRNPIYLAFTLIYTGLASLFNTLWAILVLPLVLLIINRGVIDREERYLERKFGEPYRAYKKQVKRWL